MISILFTGCNTQKKKNSPLYSEEERIWLIDFFQDTLLRKSGIFTLWGNKPLTLIQIFHYSQEEIEDYYTTIPETERNNIVINENYNLDENWIKWEKIQDRFPQDRYLLFKRDMSEDKKVSNIYLADKLKIALVIQENYTSFRNVVGFDFDPMEIANEIKNPESIFWNKSLNHAALLGILFGFGAENSWSFYWKYCTQSTCLKDFQTDFSDTPQYPTITLNSFPIPIFAIFTDERIVKQYKKEKKFIQRTYKGQDFLDLSLKRLMM